MNSKSFLCRLIDAHPENWRQICEDKYIKVKDDGALSIFTYDIFADFYDPVVQEARGIIIDTEKKDVVCCPFRKFGNSHEGYADKIDWKTAVVQEKVDGSIVKLWNNNGLWQFSSNGMIRASDVVFQTGYNMENIIEQTAEWNVLRELCQNDKLNKNYTYIFELVSPFNQVVIQYDKPALYHIGTRNNKTGQEYSDIDLGIRKPKVYPLHSLGECINAATTLNTGDFPDNEGFVVVDAKFNRVKVKCPEYLVYHHAINNGKISKEDAWELVHADDFNLDTFVKMAPAHVSDAMRYYVEEFTKTKAEAIAFVDEVHKMVEDGLSRKDIAMRIKDNRYSFFGFRSINTPELTAEEVVDAQGVKLMNLIADYEP